MLRGLGRLTVLTLFGAAICAICWASIEVPRELADAELYVFHIAGKLVKLDASHRFAPWGNGIYWALACREDCFVFAATRIGR